MLLSLRSRLKQVPAIYNLYMRMKRSVTGELLGMTSKSEQDYLTRYARDVFRFNGEIVELGCFLGATTIPLVRGMLQNSAHTHNVKQVHVYDQFTWYEGMDDAVAGTNLVGKYKIGDSFLEEYRRQTEQYSDYIAIHDGDLGTIGWHGAKIEFLLVDAMKNWALADAIVKNFYGSLIPNEGFVMHQDFAHYYSSWIHLLQWRYRDYFEFATEIPASSSVVFRCTKQIPDELLQREFSFESFADKDIDAAYEYCASLVSEEKLPNVYASKVMCYIHADRYADARRCLDKFVADGVKVEKNLIDVRAILASDF